MVRVYDRALLRSSGSNTRGPRSDGILIASRWGLREPGCEHPGYGLSRVVPGNKVVDNL